MARGAVGTIWRPPAVAEMMVRLLERLQGEEEVDGGGERERKRGEKRNNKKRPEIEIKKTLFAYLCTRVGAALASLTAIIPPIECPTRCADCQPTAS